MRCMVLGCIEDHNPRRKDKTEVSYVNFPYDQCMSIKWIYACNRTFSEVDKKTALMCAKHFREDDFIKIKDQRHLKYDAIPSLFLPVDMVEYLSMRCAVLGCNTSNFREKKANSNVSYFRFPKNTKLFKKWKYACNRPDSEIDQNQSRVCSKHFKEEDIWELQYRVKRSLRPGAVPSLHLPVDMSNYQEDETEDVKPLKPKKKENSNQLNKNSKRISNIRTNSEHTSPNKIIKLANIGPKKETPKTTMIRIKTGTLSSNLIPGQNNDKPRLFILKPGFKIVKIQDNLTGKLITKIIPDKMSQNEPRTKTMDRDNIKNSSSTSSPRTEFVHKNWSNTSSKNSDTSETCSNSPSPKKLTINGAHFNNSSGVVRLKNCLPRATRSNYKLNSENLGKSIGPPSLPSSKTNQNQNNKDAISTPKFVLLKPQPPAGSQTPNSINSPRFFILNPLNGKMPTNTNQIPATNKITENSPSEVLKLDSFTQTSEFTPAEKAIAEEIKKLRAENKRQEKILQNFAKIFTPGQMKKMHCPNRRVRWVDADMENAGLLYETNHSAYRLLCSNGFPYPPENTIRKYIAKKKTQIALEEDVEYVDEEIDNPEDTKYSINTSLRDPIDTSTDVEESSSKFIYFNLDVET